MKNEEMPNSTKLVYHYYIIPDYVTPDYVICFIIYHNIYYITYN